MNIRKRMLKVANNLMEDVVKSFEMTEEEWKKYSELHPNAKRENHQIVPDRKNQNGNDRNNKNVVRRKYRLNGGKNGAYFGIINDLKKEDPRIVLENQRILRQKAESYNNWADLQGIAMDQYTPIDSLEKLSNHYDERVRSGVARNPQITRDMMEKLSEDKSSAVRRGVAKNIGANENILKKLSQDKDVMVRAAVYFNPNVIQDIVDELEKDKEIERMIEKKEAERQMLLL